MSLLKIHDTGARTCLQDGGRYGFQGFGVGPSGAIDRVLLAIANTLVGNAQEATAFEFSQLGGRFELLEGSLLIALVGGATLEIEGEKTAAFTSYLVQAGQKFSVSHLKSGTYAYLAIGGAFELAADLGSLSFHARAGLGKAISAGESLTISPLSQEPLTLPEFKSEKALRVVLGPQDDYFSEEMISKFLAADFTISALADRMGVRLDGCELTHSQGFNIVSDGIATGAIQVPGNGVPIVLLADRQTTGGYPKIATILSCDLPHFVQLQAGAKVKFAAVKQEQAIAITRAHHARLQAYLASVKPHSSGFSSERLLGLNLVDGFMDARLDGLTM